MPRTNPKPQIANFPCPLLVSLSPCLLVSLTCHEASVRRKRPSARTGFTLVEVLIAIAIALLLIVGVSQIFAIAQRTTGMGTALLTATAADRALQNQLNRDFHAILPMSDTPGFVIASYGAAIFRNKADFDSSTTGLATDFGPN